MPTSVVITRVLKMCYPGTWQGLQILHQVGLFPGTEPQRQARVVVVNHIAQGRKSPIVIEAALRMCPQAVRGNRAPDRRHRTFPLDPEFPDARGPLSAGIAPVRAALAKVGRTASLYEAFSPVLAQSSADGPAEY
jgi:hypothetical protein